MLITRRTQYYTFLNCNTQKYIPVILLNKSNVEHCKQKIKRFKMSRVNLFRPEYTSVKEKKNSFLP